MHVIDIILEVFTWIGLGGASALGVLSVVVWAVDGSWLEADAIVDRDGGFPVLRWFGADGEADSAVPSDADATSLEGRDTARIWHRHGWRGRARLTRRPAELTALWRATAALATLGVLSLAGSWVLLFARG